MASRFTVCVNLQAHATGLKATLIQKMSKSNVNYTATFNLCLKIFLGKKFLVDSQVPKAPGEVQ